MGGKELTGKRLHRRIDLACGIMFMLYGYDAGVLGGVLDTEQFLDSIKPKGSYDIPMIASSYTLAAFFATPLVMIFGWWFGRRRTLLLGCITVIVGAAVQASASSVAHIIVGRIICGFGIGFISTTVPVYQNETSMDKDTRGRKMAITCSFLIGGIPLAYWYDYGMSFVKNSVSWRLPIASQAIFAIISGALFWSCPDTPRWYYGRGRMEEGDRTLERVWGLPIDDPKVAAEKRGIFVAIELEHNAPKLRVKDFIWDRTELKVARRLTICFLTLSFQQLMSINFLVYYSTIIFSQNGLDKNTSAILGAVLNTAFFIGTLPAIPLIDRLGRRGLMFWSAIIMTAFMTVFVALLNIPNPTKTTNWVASALIIIYILFYGTGWMGASWQYAPEIAPLELRHVGAALNASGEWLWSFVTTFASPIALADPNVGPRIWFWYLAFNILAIPFVYFCCPETAGKNLEELDTLFCKDPTVRARLQQERQDAFDAAERKALRENGLEAPGSKVDSYSGNSKSEINNQELA